MTLGTLQAAGAFDADGAIVAATGAALARGLMLAASLIILIASLAIVVGRIRFIRALRRGDSAAAASNVLPWEGVIAGAALVGIIGGVVGLWATYAHASIMSGDGIAGTLGSWFGLWSLVSVAIGIACIGLFVLRRTVRRVPLAVPVTASVAAAVLFGAVGAASELQQPQRGVEALVSVNPAVQGTVVVEPGAAGLNEVRIGLTGPDEDVEKLRRAVSSGSTTVTMRSLALGLRSEPVTVQLDDQGALIARDVIAEADGRWRVQFAFTDGDDPVLADVTLQPNPGYQK